jgi:hypothetical protein
MRGLAKRLRPAKNFHSSPKRVDALSEIIGVPGRTLKVGKFAASVLDLAASGQRVGSIRNDLAHRLPEVLAA